VLDGQKHIKEWGPNQTLPKILRDKE